MNSDGNMLMQFLQDMNGVRWLVLGVILMLAEVVTGTTYILWPAIAALILGVVVFILPVLGWQMQLLLFFILSTALMVIGHKYIRPKMKGGEPSDLNDRARSMVGMRVKAIADFDTGRGRVQVGDTQWRASMNTGDAKAGDELRVISVKGTTLNVEPYSG